MRRSAIERRLAAAEKVRPKPHQRLAIIEYRYPLGATLEEMDALASEAKAAYCKDHPECDPKRPSICLGLPHGDIDITGGST
jgi:hypothetical protein